MIEASSGPQLTLNHVQVGGAQIKAPSGQNYYRATHIFGDIATKREQYPNQPFRESTIRSMTEATPEVERVVVNVTNEGLNETNRDLKGFDIAAKVAGVGGFINMNGKGNGTDAYRMFLTINADDFTEKTTTGRNGKQETTAYFDNAKSDGEITTFGSEIVSGRQLLTLTDKDGKVHYFDPKTLQTVNP